jgi:hypothetical protein
LPRQDARDQHDVETNGSRKAAAISQALNVGAQTPISGENASSTPIAVPLSRSLPRRYAGCR